jgi:hypothetical protein
MEFRESTNLDRGKYVFIFMIVKLKFSISLSYECRQQKDLLLDLLLSALIGSVCVGWGCSSVVEGFPSFDSQHHRNKQNSQKYMCDYFPI